jgi:hypothetical protein
MLFLSLWLTFFPAEQVRCEIIDGYTNKLSAFPGDSIDLHLNASRISGSYHLTLHDLAGRHVYKIKIPVFPQTVSMSNPSEDGYGYKVTARICTPELPSGVYMWDDKIPFVIRARNPKITVVYSSNTVNAYCNAGGKSLYGFNSTEALASHKVSFLRPLPLSRHSEAFLTWMAAQNFQDVGYITDVDLEEYSGVKKSKLMIIAGHSEYWTLQARKNFDRFVHEGKNAMILSGNTMWWQVRYNKAKDQLICYRDALIDPIRSPKLKTVTWCEPSLQYPIYTSTGADFQNAGYGLKPDNGWDGYKITQESPLLEGTSLKKGDVLRCPSDELDGAPVTYVKDGTPIIDYQRLSFHKIEIVGYDLVWRAGKEGIATWIVYQPARSAGIVINTASTDWCSQRGIGVNSEIQKITRNMIQKLLKNENVFSAEGSMTVVN